jgi:hypothetical protein
MLSFVFALIALPVRAARQRSVKRGLRWTVSRVALFQLFYLFNLYFLQGRL